jgi:pyridoxal phosphate enzyme (YggS family)
VLDEHLVAARLAEVRFRIERAGGDTRAIQIVGVNKTLGPESWRIAQRLGIEAVGENYAQELATKAAEVPAADRPAVHFIGHLQTNKVRLVAGVVDVWQSVDRIGLVREICKRQGDRTPAVLIQVNTTGEPGKFGCTPTEAASLVLAAREEGCTVLGLMTMGPTDPDPVRTRSAFVLLRTLADDLGVAQRSMGMSDDLEIAVEEGTTMVRIGSALFGQRS